MHNNYMKLQFYSLPENEPFVRGSVGAFSLPLSPSLSELSDIKTAVSEAVTNAIVHAYPKGVGTVTVEARIENDTLHLKISDTGRGIDNVEEALRPFYTTLESEEHSGMGFTIMQTFMTDFKVESKKNAGTIVYMSKTIGQNAE